MPQPSHPPLPVFARRLWRLRRLMGVKQSALAERLNVNQTSISRWESGVQLPDPATQRRALGALSASRGDDATLRRLVEHSRDCVHLVDEAAHTCLAYSRRRAQAWRRSQRALLGVSLWQFATDEIQRAELGLEQGDWWSAQAPAPVYFKTSAKAFDEIFISPGGVLWERLYLADGTPVRLCSFT